MSEARYEIETTVYPATIEHIKASEDSRFMVDSKIQAAAAALRANAPVRSGAGRASITAVTERDFEAGWIGKATWDDEHYYMGIQNSRTRWATSVANRLRYV